MTAINYTNITDFLQIIQAPNSATNNTFWIGILFMIFIVLLLVLLIHGFVPALLGSSFSCLILGLLMSFGGLINFTYNLIFLGIILFSFMYLGYTGSKRV